nr:LacI family transcriptional regulator [Pararhizobium haloflavum]
MERDEPSATSHRSSERPTLKTIAFMTGLGITTVSRALKDAPDIGADTKERVRLVAKQIGYRPNRAGVRLRTGKTNVISLILNTHEEIMGITSNMVYGISEILADTQYHLVVTPYAHSNDPMEPVRYVLETGSADGVIISRTEPDDPRVRYLIEHDFPFATHGRTDMGLVHPFHDFDNAAFAQRSVERLAQKGRKRLALLAPPVGLTYYTHMMGGFSNAIHDLGLDAVPLSGIDIDRALIDIKAGTERIMRARGRPDGIVCGSGASAIAVVAGIEAAGLVLGRDVDICSKQSTAILPWFRPEISVFNEDVREAGRELARAVLGHIEGRDPATLQSLMDPR